jgi:hypothetical protein
MNEHRCIAAQRYARRVTGTCARRAFVSRRKWLDKMTVPVTASLRVPAGGVVW